MNVSSEPGEGFSWLGTGPAPAPTPMDWGRANWPAGPWDDEPDEWVGPVDYLSGVATYARRHSELGHWCGYVHVPPRHPAWGFGYDDVDVFCHWGLSYAGEPFEPVGHPQAWALGFDCGHAFDIAPGMMAMNVGSSWAARDLYERARRGLDLAGRDLLGVKDGGSFGRLLPRYRTLGYVQREIRLLLAQVTHTVTVPVGRKRNRTVRMTLPSGDTWTHDYARSKRRRVPRGPEPLRVRYVHR